MYPNKPFRLSVRAVIYDDSGRLLLLQRSMGSRNYPGKWEFPGGKVDPGERYDDALLREVKEETGLDVTIKRYIGSARIEKSVVTTIQLVMEAEIKSGSVAISNEHEAFKWVSPAGLQDIELVDWAPPFIRSHIQ